MTTSELETLTKAAYAALPHAIRDVLKSHGVQVVCDDANPDNPVGIRGLWHPAFQTIFLYAACLHSEAEVAATLRHEVAHALGFKHGAHMREVLR